MDVAIEMKMQCRMLEKESQKVEGLEKAERKKILDVSGFSQSEISQLM